MIRGDDVGGDNHVQEARLFSVYLSSFFLLKYSFRQAMLQLEFGESKPEEPQSEQSITETRKAASCSSETLKSNAGSGPAAAGCPVSNPDNLWKSPLLSLHQNGDWRERIWGGGHLQTHVRAGVRSVELLVHWPLPVLLAFKCPPLACAQNYHHTSFFFFFFFARNAFCWTRATRMTRQNPGRSIHRYLRRALIWMYAGTMLIRVCTRVFKYIDQDFSGFSWNKKRI